MIFILISCVLNNNLWALSRILTQAENDWLQAMVKKDRIALEQLVAPGFKLTGMRYIDSAAVTRSTWMQNILQDIKIDSAQFLKMKVDSSNEVGIVRAKFYWTGTYENHFADTTSVVDTWIKINGDWQVVHRVMID